MRRFWFAWILVAANFVTSFALYHLLPPTIAIHWNARGAVDGWAPKWIGAFTAPCIALILVGFLILLGRWMSEEALEEDGASSTQLREFWYPTIVAAVAGICFYANATVLSVGVGMHLDMPSHTAIGLGLLIAVLGYTLGKVPQNRAVGIRTPWTLGDEEVWRRTHRTASWLFVMAGMASVATGGMGEGMTPSLIAIGCAAIVSVAYSYLIARH